MRSEIGGRRIWIGIVVAEQVIQEVAGTLHGVGILRPAIILRQRQQNRAALVFAIAAGAAAQPLEAGRDGIEVGAHLLDLVVHRTALRRRAIEQGEKKPELSQPIRLACEVTRSSSACCLVAASW